MQIPHGTLIAVADGTQIELYRNQGDEVHAKLTPLPAPAIQGHSKDSGKRHRSSAANPDDENVAEDSFIAAVADWLNRQALEGKIEHLVVIAAPKALGELRRHYGKALSGKILIELHKELIGRPVAEVEAALAHAKAP